MTTDKKYSLEQLNKKYLDIEHTLREISSLSKKLFYMKLKLIEMQRKTVSLAEDIEKTEEN